MLRFICLLGCCLLLARVACCDPLVDAEAQIRAGKYQEAEALLDRVTGEVLQDDDLTSARLEMTRLRLTIQARDGNPTSSLLQRIQSLRRAVAADESTTVAMRLLALEAEARRDADALKAVADSVRAANPGGTLIGDLAIANAVLYYKMDPSPTRLSAAGYDVIPSQEIAPQVLRLAETPPELKRAERLFAFAETTFREAGDPVTADAIRRHATKLKTDRARAHHAVHGAMINAVREYRYRQLFQRQLTEAIAYIDKLGGVLVCTSKNGYAYHVFGCPRLDTCEAEIIDINPFEAARLGRTPCIDCKAPGFRLPLSICHVPFDGKIVDMNIELERGVAKARADRRR